MSHLDTLWELQSVLNELADREKRMSRKPDSFAEVDDEYQAAAAEMTRIEGQLETLQKERRRVDGELADQQETLKKYQGQLMQVKNQQQYAAAWKEIDTARKQAKELEDSALKAMGEIEGLEKQLEEKRGGFGALKERYDAAYEEWQHSLGDLKEEAESLKQKAAGIEATLPPQIRGNFQRILKQRQGIAVTKVSNGDSCSSCRSRVRPALFQQLKREEIVLCEGCHRILYVEKPAS